MTDINFLRCIIAITLVLLVSVAGAFWLIYTNIVNKYEKEKLQILINVEDKSFINAIEFNRYVLDSITTLAEFEISAILNPLFLLNSKYDVIHFDEDVAKISTTVFNAYKEEFFGDPNMVYKAEYMMAFITKIVSSILLEKMKTLNEAIALKTL